MSQTLTATQRIDFSELVRCYETPLLRYAAQLAGAEEAEDVVQEVFLRLHRQISRKGPASITTISQWVFRVCRNAALDARKARRQRRKAQDQAPTPGARELDQLGQLVRRAACDRALEEVRSLPETQRQVLLLKLIQGMTLREIGQVMQMTTGQAAHKLNQGLATVARRLKDAEVI